MWLSFQRGDDELLALAILTDMWLHLRKMLYDGTYYPQGVCVSLELTGDLILDSHVSCCSVQAIVS